MEQTTRIGLISDTHFWPGCPVRFGDGSQIQPWSELVLEVAAAEIMKSEPDLLLHLGDYCCGGGVFEMPTNLFYESLNHLHQRLSRIAPDYYGLPGNHDLPSGHISYTYSEKLLGLEPGMGRTIDLPQARLILLNCQGQTAEQFRNALPNDPVIGWISPEELDRLDEELAGAKGRPILLFTHQLLWTRSTSGPLDRYYAIQNREEVLVRLADYPNVVAIFGGHAHRYDVQRLELGGHKRHALIVPSLIEFPLGWIQLELDENKVDIQFRPLPLDRLPFLKEEMTRELANPRGRLASAEWHSFSVPLRD